MSIYITVIDKSSRARIAYNTFCRNQDIFYDCFFSPNRESQFIRRGSYDFFFQHDRYSAGYFFSAGSPHSFSGADRVRKREGSERREKRESG